MIKKNMLFHSRNLDYIITYVDKSNRVEVNFERSKKVKHEVIEKLENVIEQMIG